MGGDLAPVSVIDGVKIASKKLPNIEFNIFGNKKKILSILGKDEDILNKINFINTSKVISNDTKPTEALRKSKESSMFKAINSVRKGESHAVVSGGNTGALMVISTVLMKTIKGIDRPAIASMFPTTKSETVMLDLGANINCSVILTGEFFFEVCKCISSFLCRRNHENQSWVLTYHFQYII